MKSREGSEENVICHRTIGNVSVVKFLSEKQVGGMPFVLELLSIHTNNIFESGFC